MMRIDIISVMPDYFDSSLKNGVIEIAISKGLLNVNIHNLYHYGIGQYLQIDDNPFGGGPGMILKPEPIFDCIENLTEKRNYDEIIFLSPDGEKFDQKMANKFSLNKNMIMLCGHYKGVDERVRESLITREISIGDYVLSGGEAPAICLVDAITRLLPGSLGNSESALTDAFQEDLLDCAYYTRPSVFRDMKVPQELMSGNHKLIDEWREKNARIRTEKRRPDIFKEK